tara:strand:+ start:2644 stop:3393 length:750 start_codon:yes stop_codon:yes gene_type:complete
MSNFRRTTSARWWNKKKIWILFIFLVSILSVRISKNLIYRDIYYLISKPFWPGEYQREILFKSVDQALNIKIKQLEKDNYRLRKLLLIQNTSDNNKINASVISRNISSWWQTILLNKGSRDGVAIGDPVLGPGGLLGIIEDTSFMTSSVRLLTSLESKVGVFTQRTNMHGLLMGEGSNLTKLVFYLKDIDIKVGDTIVSSPASTLLPPNIPIGIVESIDVNSKPITTASVQLIAKPQAIDWVQIFKLDF